MLAVRRRRIAKLDELIERTVPVPDLGDKLLRIGLAGLALITLLMEAIDLIA